MSDRRSFLTRSGLALGALIVGDAALDAFERLTHVRKSFPSAAITPKPGPWCMTSIESTVYPETNTAVYVAHVRSRHEQVVFTSGDGMTWTHRGTSVNAHQSDGLTTEMAHRIVKGMSFVRHGQTVGHSRLIEKLERPT